MNATTVTVAPHPDRWRLAAYGLAVGWLAALLLTWFALHTTDWRGDEYTYVAGARLVAGLLTGRAASPLPDDLAAGWFMPGLYVLGAPAFLIDPDPPLWVARGWMGLINAALSLALVRSFASLVGRRLALFLAVFPGLAPLWHVAAFSFLPDLPAGLLLAIALTLSARIGARILAGEAPRYSLVAGLQGLLIAGLFMRGPMLLPALGVPMALIVVAAAVRHWRAAGRLAIGLAAFAAVLGSWSALVSRHFGEFVLTTTNVPLVLADSFGDPANNCVGPCPRSDDDIWPAWKHAHAVAAETGENPLAVQRRIRDRALADLTACGYLRQVREHFATFLFDPGGTLRAFLPVSYGMPRLYREPFLQLLTGLTLLTYLPFLCALLLANLAVFRRDDAHRLESILIKLATACLFLQPFVHKSSGRYWVAFAPLAAWALALLVRAWRTPPGEQRPSALPRWYDLAQILYSATFAALALVIVFA